jgi:hypothetical protein
MNELPGYFEISIHPTRINHYYVSLRRRGKNTVLKDPDQDNEDKPSKRPSQFENNYHNGKISKQANRKICRAIDYMVYLAKPKKLPKTRKGQGFKFKLNFITLTLSSPQIHSDYEITNKVFGRFADYLRRKWNVHHYIWRAEKQANGSIHYHVITDRFIPWLELRDTWNNCQELLGYVTRYRKAQKLWHKNGFHYRPELEPKWSYKHQLKAYQEGIRTDWNSPNSTDVHSLRFVNNVRAYFKKYLTKSGQSSRITSRLWGTSQSLSSISGARVMEYSRISEELDRLEKDDKVQKVHEDFYTTYLVDMKYLIQSGYTELAKTFYDYLTIAFPAYVTPQLFSG